VHAAYHSGWFFFALPGALLVAAFKRAPARAFRERGPSAPGFPAAPRDAARVHVTDGHCGPEFWASAGERLGH
jgi:hypothetical protein